MARSPAKTAAPAPRAAAPAPAMAPAQAAAPDPMANIPRDGRAVSLGRDGKPVYRQSSVNSDPFSIAAELQPPGWIYEWKRYSVHNQPDYTYHAQVQRVGGWTPVQNERHPGIWLPPDHKGAIVIDGLMLMERPINLHIEARNELKAAADAKVRQAKVERGLQAATSGIDVNTAAARNASFVKEGRLLDGNVGRDGMTDADAIAEARPTYSYDRQSVD